MDEKTLKPEIRFKGFTEAWEQRQLVEIAVIAKGQQLNKSLLSNEGTYYVLNGGMTPSGYTDSYNTKANTISISEGGNSCGFVAYNKENFWSGGHNYTLSQLKIDVKYLYQDLKRQESYIMSLRVGSGLPNVQKARLSEVMVNYPALLKEQNKIASFLMDVDNLITLHQRKFEKLQSIKKGLLEKMFPADGSLVPSIRFKGFTEAWEQRELGNIGSTYTGLSGKSKDDFGHGDGKFVTYMNVFKNPIADESVTEPIEIDNSQREVKYGDIFFTTSSETPEEVGMSSVWLYNSQNTYLNSFCFGYRFNGDVTIDPYFVGYLLRSPQPRKSLELLAQGISRYNISKTKVMDINISIPTLIEEQIKVGSFMLEIDNLITLHQRKCEKLQNIKKALLQKMFC